jgi:hypothetical protein
MSRRFQLNTIVLIAALAPLSSALSQQRVDLRGTRIAFSIADRLSAAGRGNERNSEITNIYVDLTRARLVCDAKIYNREIVKLPPKSERFSDGVFLSPLSPVKPIIGPRITVWDFTVHKSFSIDLNEPALDSRVDFGNEITVGTSDLVDTMGLRKDWATLTVDSKPSEAKISVNGKEWGMTKNSGFAGAGKHELRLEMPGFKTFDTVVTLKKGQDNPFFFELQK